MQDTDFQTIQSIGRPALIQKLSDKTSFTNDAVIEGPGDDAAVIEKEEETCTLITSEMFMEGVDFDLTYMPLHHLGYKVLSALVSDIYAMNGRPNTANVNLAVPNKISTQMLGKIYEGLQAAAKDYEVQITGGDLTAAHKTLAISVSGTGTADKERMTYRRGANPGDTVCVSGDLGGAIAGLRILMREKQYWQEGGDDTFQPELDEYEYVVKRQLVPIARKQVIQYFHEKGIVPSAMIDVTQGLANDIQRLTAASNCGVHLYQAALPIAVETRNVANEMQEDVDKYALYGGEDLELLFTLPEEKADSFVQEHQDVTIIGQITEESEGIRMQTAEGETVQFEENNDNIQ